MDKNNRHILSYQIRLFLSLGCFEGDFLRVVLKVIFALFDRN
jgi:hypothetical protein